jgi:hypothetical protein
MSLDDLQRFIYDLYSDESVFQDYRSEPREFVNKSLLTPEQKTAIIQRDYAFLYREGVHPMLVAHMMQIDQVAFQEEESPERLKMFMANIRGLKNSYQDFYKK